MPFIVRDPNGKILRVSARAIPLADMVAPNDPELMSFLKDRGQDPEAIDTIFSELRRTDGDMSRAIEDLIMALMRKNILKMTDLPKAVQDKMALRVRLRVAIQEAYDRASGQHSSPSSPSAYDAI